ncbi:hypothetical protein TNCV_4804341 [Trichonephila clavipes]|nr:hypothetical protein TNCV_4804341 [Trichonephila clavipes]
MYCRKNHYDYESTQSLTTVVNYLIPGDKSPKLETPCGCRRNLLKALSNDIDRKRENTGGIVYLPRN